MRSDAEPSELVSAYEALGRPPYRDVAQRAADAGIPLDWTTCHRVLTGRAAPTSRTLYGLALALELHDLARVLEAVIGTPRAAA